MKKIIILFSVIALWSCEKQNNEEIYCYTCNVYKIYKTEYIDTCVNDSLFIQNYEKDKKNTMTCYKKH